MSNMDRGVDRGSSIFRGFFETTLPPTPQERLAPDPGHYITGTKMLVNELTPDTQGSVPTANKYHVGCKPTHGGTGARSFHGWHNRRGVCQHTSELYGKLNEKIKLRDQH